MLSHDAFERDGYAIAQGVIPPTELQAWSRICDTMGVTLARNLLADGTALRLASSGAAAKLATELLGQRATPVRGLRFDKTPEENWAVAWHRDTAIAVAERPEAAPVGFDRWTTKAGVPHVIAPTELLGRMVTLRIALDRCDRANGPLRVLPGSHLPPSLHRDASEVDPDGHSAVDCLTEAGDVVLMRPTILHASRKATVPRRRRVVHLEYAAEALPRPLKWYDWNERRIH